MFSIYYIISPVLGAAIGYITNWIAIRMLFRPYQEKKLFGGTLPFTPGLIPARRFELAKKLGETISLNILTDEMLVEALKSEEVKNVMESAVESIFDEIRNSDNTIGEKLMSYGFTDQEVFKTLLSEKKDLWTGYFIDSLNSTFFADKIKPVIKSIIDKNLKGLASIFISSEKVYNSIIDSITEYLKDSDNSIMMDIENIAEKVAEIFMSVKLSSIVNDDIESLFRRVKSGIMDKYDEVIDERTPIVIKAINLPQIIESKINEFEMAKVEELIVSVTDRELKAITYLGGLLGFVIGLIAPIAQSLLSF